MDVRAMGTLRMILHGAACVLGCGSAQMAILDPARAALVIRVAVSNVDEQRFQHVESLLGFPTDGLAMPLANESSVLVRAAREGRILVTARFAEIAGDLVSDDLARQVQSIIGTQTFAAVPVSGRSGLLAVILFVKPGESGFAPADRDLLVAYADRVGAALESGELDADVDVLESLGDLGVPPPSIFFCDERLCLAVGEGEGQPLDQVLRAEGARKSLEEAAMRLTDGARSLTVRTDDGRMLRVTLRPTALPAVSVGLSAGSTASGRAAGFVAVVEDVGWLERLGREAARARDHLARVLGSVGDAVFTLDRVGNIVGCSGAVRRLFDQAPSELLGRPITDLLADARAQKRAASFSRRLAASGFVEGELAFQRGGRTLPVAVAGLLLADDRGTPTGSLWRVQDLSARRRGDAERRRLRARLLRSERLSALGEMAARIAHEVRNPLVSIGAAAKVVLEELEEGSTVREEVSAIAREVRRLDTIVSGLLHAARPTGLGPRRAAQRAVDLGELLAETIDLLGTRGRSARFTQVKNGDCRVQCEADGVRQVLWNVLINAVEASPPGGTVACEVRALPGKILIAISDEGPGISPKVRAHLFDPFFSTKARGTGLGLLISSQIVEEHQGRLRLTSRRHGGTRVVIELPRARGAPAG